MCGVVCSIWRVACGVEEARTEGLDFEFIEHLLMHLQRLEAHACIRCHHTRRSHSWHPNSWKNRVPAQLEVFDRCVACRENVGASHNGRTVGATVTTEEALVRERRSDLDHVLALANIGDHALDCLPQHLRALDFELRVLGGLAVKALPQIIRLSRGRIRMQRVHPVWRQRGIEHGGNRNQDQILLRIDAFVPIVDNHVVTEEVFAPHCFLQTLSTEPQVQMHERRALAGLLLLFLPCRWKRILGHEA
mmetsp:Transcript_38663/g.56837  ORF Transcript_38663/g.56837 Transcript_38663/m.56837 type:complete len:248 (-) Transcript_38663:536-1279(-)